MTLREKVIRQLKEVIRIAQGVYPTDEKLNKLADHIISTVKEKSLE